MLLSYILQYAMIDSTGGVNQHLEAHDLIPDHAYTLLHVIELRGNRLVFLRNPWGMKEWNGRWSPTSSERTVEPNASISYTDQPGAFWITSRALSCTNYESVVVYFVNENLQHASISSWVVQCDIMIIGHKSTYMYSTVVY